MPKSKRKLPIDLDSLARAYTEVNVQTLGAWATNEKTDADIRIRAIGMLLDRGWGRPKQTHDATVQGALDITIRKLLGEDE